MVSNTTSSKYPSLVDKNAFKRQQSSGRIKSVFMLIGVVYNTIQYIPASEQPLQFAFP